MPGNLYTRKRAQWRNFRAEYFPKQRTPEEIKRDYQTRVLRLPEEGNCIRFPVSPMTLIREGFLHRREDAPVERAEDYVLDVLSDDEEEEDEVESIVESYTWGYDTDMDRWKAEIKAEAQKKCKLTYLPHREESHCTYVFYPEDDGAAGYYKDKILKVFKVDRMTLLPLMEDMENKLKNPPTWSEPDRTVRFSKIVECMLCSSDLTINECARRSNHLTKPSEGQKKPLKSCLKTTQNKNHRREARGAQKADNISIEEYISQLEAFEKVRKSWSYNKHLKDARYLSVRNYQANFAQDEKKNYDFVYDPSEPRELSHWILLQL